MSGGSDRDLAFAFTYAFFSGMGIGIICGIPVTELGIQIAMVTIIFVSFFSMFDICFGPFTITKTTPEGGKES